MKLNVPCEVTMNGDYPTYKEEWDNFSDAESYCDSSGTTWALHLLQDRKS